ncbi:MAG: AAA family ATPase [Fibrobacteria bacterium]|nr:AAA family ATPase [Fibrobacteria bacterium]
MTEEPQEIKSLRDALSFSPDNVTLRKLLGDTLIKYGRFEEAEQIYKQGLELNDNNTVLKTGLAQACFQLKKNNESFILLEELAKENRLAGDGLLLYIKLLAKTTEITQAVQLYAKFKKDNPEIHDEELETELSPFMGEYAYDDPEDPRRQLTEEPEDSQLLSFERPSITFKDVGGMDDVKKQLQMKIVHPLNNAELFKAYGKTIGGGILLYGPPGCGKTFLARATAGEVNANFFSIGLHEILDMWIGKSEQNLHEVFEQARVYSPSILFFDEVDALGAKRSDMRQSGGRHTINQFLSEMDGMTSSNEGVLILAATNAPWHLDSAFRRPGRFDNIMFVPPPDCNARAAIIESMLKQKPIDNIDFNAVAKKIKGFTGADIKGIVDKALENKLEEAMVDGQIKPLKTKDLIKATKKAKPTAKEWFATAKNYALYANQGGIYNDILEYMESHK